MQLRSSNTTLVSGPLAGRTVLVLLHDPCALDALAAALERAGARLVKTRSYAEALPLVLLEKIDALVVEVSPTNARDGVELVRTVRGLSPLAAHLRTACALALGELPSRRASEEPVVFDDRLERASAPGKVVTRLVTLLHAGASHARPAA